jgi:hypothetical protein
VFWLRWFRGVPITVVALALAGAADAHGGANHHVSISIPTALRLRVDEPEARDTLSVPIRVEVTRSQPAIDPASTRLQVFANVAWQLSVSYRPVGDASGLALSWHTQAASGLLRSAPGIVASGPGTGRWRTIDVGYGVANEPAEGEYYGVIAYTLARP